MKVKFFLAFALVTAISLLSNIAFRNMMAHDFEDFMRGGQEDRIYLLLASLESSYDESGWDAKTLDNTLFWALMLGYEVNVFDEARQLAADTRGMLSGAGPLVIRRLEGLGVMPTRSEGGFETYPLYLSGRQIGTLEVRDTETARVRDARADVFRARGRMFLLVSLIGTGVGAFVAGLALTLYLNRPISALTDAAKRIREGDLGARVGTSLHNDEIGQLGHAFNEMVETLQRQEALRKNLVTDLAHEFRTPLSVLAGTFEAIDDGVIKPDAATLKNLVEETRRLERLVSGIEEMARSESGYFFIRKDAVGLDVLVASVAESYRPLFIRKGIALGVNRDSGGGIVVHGDPDRLNQVVVNILSNALRYTDHGRVDVSVYRQGGQAVIEVADTGRGIDPENRERIFERFYKGRDSEGLGLGLAIVKSIVEAHEGSVECAAREGGGTVFTVRIPA
ncbi:MAG: HAMP domain-containing histidine kinase [Nitrospirae bacterium]|nr:HAMP domain-containing histidine kinase [Nitrospirota bacterium]